MVKRVKSGMKSIAKFIGNFGRWSEKGLCVLEKGFKAIFPAEKTALMKST